MKPLFRAMTVAGLFLAHAISSAQQKEVSIYTMQLKPMYTKYMEDMFARFEQANPGLKVKWLDFPYQDYETKLLSLIQSGNAPDVQNLSFEYMLRLQERGQLLPLEDKVSSELKGEYVDSILSSSCRVKGELYALPWYQATNVLMYNKDILKEAGLDPAKPPKTVDEMMDMSRQIKQKADKFGFLPVFTDEGALKGALAAEGIPLTDAAGKKATFNTPAGVKLLSRYKALFDEKVIPRETVMAEHRRMIELYKSGKTAFFHSGPQFLLVVKNESPKVYAATGVSSAFPIKGTNNFESVSQNLCIYAKSKNQKEAIDLALWVTSGENQLAFSKLVTILPSVKSALKDPYFSQPGNSPEDKARNVAAKQLETAVNLVPPLPRLGELNKVMNETVQNVLVRNMPADQALKEAEQKWNEILAK